MDAPIAGMQPGISFRRNIQEWKRVVGPGTAGGGKKRISGIGFPAHDQSAGAFQAYGPVFIPAKSAIGVSYGQSVLGLQEPFGIAEGSDKRIIRFSPEPQSHRIKPGLLFYHR